MDATKLRPQLRKLGFPNRFYYEAAEGWLLLGDDRESLRELEQISADQNTHPDVLNLRWRISSKRGEWDHCLVVARAMTQLYPTDARSWIALAESFYALGDVHKAFKIAAANCADFPDCWSLLYDAACYACLVGKFDKAKHYFQLAMQVGDPKAIRSKASQDPNLKALCREPARARKQGKP